MFNLAHTPERLQVQCSLLTVGAVLWVWVVLGQWLSGLDLSFWGFC